MINYKNINQILVDAKQSYAERVDTGDIELYVTPNTINVGDFGNSPLDVMEFSVYDQSDVETIIYWEGNHAFSDLNKFSIDGKERFVLNPGKDIENSPVDNGEYFVVYGFYRNVIGSSDGMKLVIQEISKSRKEIRLIPYITETMSNTQKDSINNTFFNVFKDSAYLENNELNVLLNFGNNAQNIIINSKLDDGTISVFPYSVVLKLYEPLITTIDKLQLCWVCKEMSKPIVERVKLIRKFVDVDKYNKILRPANFNIKHDIISNNQTAYQNWETLVSTNNDMNYKIINSAFSSSFFNSDLDMDYSDYSNFIKFSSAEERLNNFIYKLQLLESYDARIFNLTNTSASVSQSIYVNNEVTKYRDYKSNLLSTIEGYEAYLYYTSGSQYSSSLYPATQSVWYNPIGEYPKTTSTLPYTLAATTASIATTWLSNQLVIARNFDKSNIYSLIHNIPRHFEENENTQFKLLMHMFGEYYDSLYNYISRAKEMYHRGDNPSTSAPSILQWDVAKSLGFDIGEFGDASSLWNYMIGTDLTGSYLNTGSMQSLSYRDINKEITRRLINNSAYLYQTKGTEQGLRALINIFGVPESILSIKEFGGPPIDRNNDSSLYLNEQKHVYYINFEGSQYVSSSWQRNTVSAIVPTGIEFRFKTSNTASANQILIQKEKDFAITAEYSQSNQGFVSFWLSGSAGTLRVRSSLMNIYENEFYSVLLTRMTASDSSSIDNEYRLYVKKFDDEKINRSSVSSLYITSSFTQSYQEAFARTGSLYIGGAATILTGSSFIGSMQELRKWGVVLNEDSFNTHVRFLKSYYGNSYSSSYDDLLTRYSFDSNTNLYSTPTIYNIAYGNLNADNAIAVNFDNKISYGSDIFKTSALVLSSIHAPMSNKIRIETNYLSGTLSVDKRVERGSYDYAPLDSNRVGIYLSPVNIINEDIISSFANTNLDNYIGNPNEMYSYRYTTLKSIVDFYFKKYLSQNNFNLYIRILQYFNKNLFTLLKDFIPARCQPVLGGLIEPHLLERNKVQYRESSIDDSNARLQAPTINLNQQFTVGGEYNSYIGTVDSDKNIIPTGEYVSYNGTADIEPTITCGGEYKVYNGTITNSSWWGAIAYQHWQANVTVIDGLPASYTSSLGLELAKMPFIYQTSSLARRNFYYSIGMYNLKYGGCRQTDLTTPDGGPVVEIVYTNPNIIKVTNIGASSLTIE